MMRLVILLLAFAAVPYAAADPRTPTVDGKALHADIDALMKKLGALDLLSLDSGVEAVAPRLEPFATELAKVEAKVDKARALVLPLHARAKVLTAEIDVAIDAVTDAKTDKERVAAKAKLTQLQAENARLEIEIEKHKDRANATEEKTLALFHMLDLKLHTLTERLRGHQREVAKAKLEALRKERDRIEQELKKPSPKK